MFSRKRTSRRARGCSGSRGSSNRTGEEDNRLTPLRAKSIRGKLKTVIMSTSMLSILLTTAGFVVYEYATFRQFLVNDLSTKAEIIGQNCSAAIVFANAEDAQQTLEALRSQPHIEFAAVYNKEGSLFVTYARVQRGPPAPAKPEPGGFRFEQNRLRLFQPIIVNNARVGTLYVESNLEALNDRIVSYGSIALLVVVTSSIVAFLFASRLQKRISQPILALAETSRVVSERQDYSVRAQKISDDELGALADAFNGMLSQIQLRETTLQQANAAMTREIAERNKAEKVLGASEERFRRLFDSHPLPMWVYDAQSLQFLVVNESAMKEYGYSREEFLDMRITEIRPPDEIPDLLANVQSGRPPLQSYGPWRHRRKDGELVEVEIVSHSTEFEGRPAFLVVAMNITERRKAERELKTSEERYRSLVSAMTSIVWTADDEGKFALPQRSWEKYTGQRWEEHAGLGCMNAIHPDDRDRVRKVWEEASAAQTLYESEGRIWHAQSRSYRHFTARAVPLFRPDKTVREWTEP
ncbi:MAG: PAS domain S-box protein [Ignavibacteria bacterium]|nr:MAG: PAS domain S-box protein [Ignavibacteria bacterium]